MTFRWVQTAGPSFADVTNADAGDTVVSGLVPGMYTFQLIVTEGGGLVASDTVTVYVPRVDTPIVVGDAPENMCYVGQPCSLAVQLQGFAFDHDLPAMALVWSRDESVESIASGVLVSGPDANVVWNVDPLFPVGTVAVTTLVSARFPDGNSWRVDSASVEVTIVQPLQWQVGAFGNCSRECGTGVQTRSAKCMHTLTDTPRPDSTCAAAGLEKPATSAPCFEQACPDATYELVTSAFGACSVTCGTGVRTRTVDCRSAAGTPVDMSLCAALGSASTTEACQQSPCDTYALTYTAYSGCTRQCGGGVMYRSAVCRSVQSGAPVATDKCMRATLEDLEAPCNTAPCAEPYQWEQGIWGVCSATCGGGVATRDVTCRRVSDGAVSSSPDVDCAATPRPATTRECGTQPCDRTAYMYQVSEYTQCSGCGGQRTREVVCVARSIEGSAVVDDSLCTGVRPSETESCPSCSYCTTGTCSGHGACVEATRTCECDRGYSGDRCQMSASCAGPRDGRGTCCGTNTILTASDECCAGTGSGAAPVLDKDGLCCASGTLNRCGVCDGPAAAVFSADLSCCVSGVLDAEGVCCASGDVDSFGVCDGGDATGLQELGVTVTLPSTVTLPQLQDPTTDERIETDATLRGMASDGLSRSSDDVVVVDYASLRRMLQAAAAREMPAVDVTTTMQLLPYGGPNNLPPSILSSLLAGAPSTGGVALGAVTSLSSLPVCGNDACESGERPDRANGIVGCAIDCRYPVLSCPAVNGAVCNGVGHCAEDVDTGLGRCVCNPLMGYTGNDCSGCAPGFLSIDGLCTRMVASFIHATAGHSSSHSHDSSDSGWITGIVVGVGGALAAIVAYVVVRSRRASVTSPRESVKPEAQHPAVRLPTSYLTPAQLDEIADESPLRRPSVVLAAAAPSSPKKRA